MVFRNLFCKSNDNKFWNDRNSFIRVVPNGWLGGLLQLVPAAKKKSLVLSPSALVGAALFISIEGWTNLFSPCPVLLGGWKNTTKGRPMNMATDCSTTISSQLCCCSNWPLYHVSRAKGRNELLSLFSSPSNRPFAPHVIVLAWWLWHPVRPR